MIKTRGARPALLLATALLASAVPVQAHGAAPPADYLTRILSDYSDDWFGVMDGHNVIALDGYTQYNASLGGDVVVLRLVLDGGYSQQSAATGKPELAEHITFQANGKDQEYAVNTEDNQDFESELGFKAIRGPEPQLTADGTPDGTRFFVEGLIPFADLGIKAGDSLSGFFVQGEAGDGEGDAMPQYDLTPGGMVPAASDDVHADIGSWIVPATDRYVKTTTAGPSKPVPLAGEVMIDLTLANAFNESQSVMAMAYGDGLAVAFTGAPTTNVSMGMLDLQALKGGALQLHVARLAFSTPAPAGNQTHGHSGNATANSTTPVPSHGMVTIDVTTSLGGHQVVTVPFDIAQPPASNTTTESDHDHHEDAKKSPTAGLPILAAAMAAVVVALRRRD